MKNKAKEKGSGGLRLTLLCLVLLCNPFIKTLDLLPDFICYFYITKLLSDISYKAPYFEELRTSVKRLGYLSLARLAAELVLNALKQRNSSIDDTVTLFVLVFAAIEIIMTVIAVRNLYRALEYLSERTSAASLFEPYVTRRGHKDDLRTLISLTYIFTVLKCVGNLIPEMLLLYKDPLSGGFNPRFLYPYISIACFAFILIFGIVWAKKCYAYFKHIKSESMSIFAMADELVTEKALASIANKKQLKTKKDALLIMTVAAFLNFEIALGEFRQINLLPTVIFALLMTYGFFKLIRGTESYLMQRTASWIFIGASALKAAVQLWFLLAYEYSDLLDSKAAINAYKLVIAAAIIEALSFIFYMITFAVSMGRYTDISLRSSNLDTPDKTELEYKRSFRVKAWVFSLIGCLVSVIKCAEVIINSTVNLEYVSTSDSTVGEVFYSNAPWIVLLIGLSVILFGFYGIHYFGAIKDDEELKHSEFMS